MALFGQEINTPSLLSIQRKEMEHGPRVKTYDHNLMDLLRGGLMGVSTDVLGAPVDLATMAMRPFGYDVPSQNIVGGSDWLANRLTSPTGSAAEASARVAAGLLTPSVTDIMHVLPLLGMVKGGKNIGNVRVLKGPTGMPYIEGMVKYTDIPKGRFSFEDGVPTVELPKVFKGTSHHKDYGFRMVDEYLWPYGDDVYIRVSDNIDDIKHIKGKTHRGSKNWATGEPEGGLSVAKDIEFPAKHMHLVKGKRIGSGTDGEPLLDVSTVEMVKPITWGKLKKDRIKKAEKMGISEEIYRLLRSGSVQYKKVSPE